MINVYKYTLQSIQNGEFWQAFPKNVDLWRQSDPFEMIRLILWHNRPLLNYALQHSLKMIGVSLSATMLDCLASDHSHGFFDEHDVPPPELWVDYLADNNTLIAVVPPIFESIVTNIIENYSMSESIIWYSPN